MPHRKYRIFDNMIEGVQVLDQNLNYLYINRAAAAQGKSAIGDLLGHSITEKYPGIEKTHLYETITRCLKEKKASRWVNDFTFPDGTKGWFDLRMEPVDDGVLIMSFDITAQKILEQDLKELNYDLSDYKYALDASSIVAITDKEGVIVYANDNFCKVSKYAREELIGKTHKIVNSGYHSKEFFVDLWRTIASGKVWKGEIKNKGKDGSTYWVDTTIVPFLDYKGRPFKYLAIRSDITGRKEIEEQLRATERRTRFLIENTPAGVAMFDRDMRYLMVSKRWLEDFRLGDKNIIGLSHYEVFPEISEEWKEYHRRALEGEKFNSEGEAFPRADGTVDWTKWDLFPWYTETGSIGGVVLFTEDITARKLAEENLKRSEENYRSIFENSIVSMITTDMKTQRPVLINDFGAKLFGYRSKQDFLDNYQVTRHFIHPRDRNNTLKKIKTTGFYESNTVQLRKLNGEFLWAKLYVRVNEDKTLAHTVVIDVTKEVNLSRNLTNKIHELEVANKELESFNYVSSHDMQEPLRKIQSFSGILLAREKDGLSDEGKYHLERMADIARQMQSFIEALLTYTRVKKAKRVFEMVDLSGIVADVVKDFEKSISAKKAVIKYDNLCEAKIIPFQIQQLFSNLLSNSLKFTSPLRPPTIEITSRLAAGNVLKQPGLLKRKKYCHITFADNGIGFDPLYNERVFEFFERLDKNKYPGTGIGLAICKRIVENHNGIITAKGELDKGARFDIYLPLG